MTIFIGRKLSIGIGKESVRGTAVAATYWMPKMDFSVEDKVKTVVDDSSLGVIEDANSSEVVQTYSQGSFGGRVSDVSFGLILMATFGTDTLGAVETGVKDHVFTVLESAQHPTLTVSVSEPNATNLRYPLCMIDSLEIDAEIGKYCTYKVSFTGNDNGATSNSVSYTAENIFLPQMATCALAATYGGLSGASAINTRKLNIKITKNTEDDVTIGNVAAVDRYNKQFAIEGSIELMYNDRSYIDTIMQGDLVKAIRIKLLQTVTIGAASFPTLTIDLARCKIQDVARNNKNNDLMIQTIKFKAFYSLSDSLLAQVTLRNTVTTAY